MSLKGVRKGDKKADKDTADGDRDVGWGVYKRTGGKQKKISNYNVCEQHKQRTVVHNVVIHIFSVGKVSEKGHNEVDTQANRDRGDDDAANPPWGGVDQLVVNGENLEDKTMSPTAGGGEGGEGHIHSGGR